MESEPAEKSPTKSVLCDRRGRAAAVADHLADLEEHALAHLMCNERPPLIATHHVPRWTGDAFDFDFDQFGTLLPVHILAPEHSNNNNAQGHEQQA